MQGPMTGLTCSPLDAARHPPTGLVPLRLRSILVVLLPLLSILVAFPRTTFVPSLVPRLLAYASLLFN